ncbi:MAG: hypothetical protein D6689_20660 [Deltaproteobacteria bacterium]|nr:MAG: hypothetical protein D6689_20660 [Deltaproteobacteria bacterium]
MTTSPKTLLSIATLALAGAALGGCAIYFDDRDDSGGGYTYCDDTGCWYCDDYGDCYPGGDGGWGECSNNYDCAAGCYCEDGACVETGFCEKDADCRAGMVCDDRGTCVPEGSGELCTSDADCPYGTYCDEASGACVGSWTCTDDGDCGPGYECDDRGTCVPSPCTDDSQCLEGCVCVDGTCEETGTCSADADCGEGMKCDKDRNTCTPCGADGCEPVNPGNCYEPAVCEIAPPVCPSGTLPGVADGCYTGVCIPEALCPDEPPFTCADAADEADCLDHGCEPVYVGVNCTDPDGGTCVGDEPDCTCEYFEYGFCRDRAAP